MADSYHITDDNQVIPYSGGRMNTNTDSWRDATDLEIEQKRYIQGLEARIDRAINWITNYFRKDLQELIDILEDSK